ncbi:hypothetical protein C5E10_05375 [Pseudoclavibacter sp. RFBG4]|nr:hypothetical protein C5E10_05375 [Pseudoclavibacter sp. RFBG4]
MSLIVDEREAARLEALRVEQSRLTKDLLDLLELNLVPLENYKRENFLDTYSIPRDQRRAIERATRLLVDSGFREFVELSLDVVEGLWIPPRMGEDPDEPFPEQRRVFAQLVRETGRLTSEGGWSTELLESVRRAKEHIDVCAEDYFADRRS